MFNGDRLIAYRIGTNEVGTYQYSRWIEPPVAMVQSSQQFVYSKGQENTSPQGRRWKQRGCGQFYRPGPALLTFEEVVGPSITGYSSRSNSNSMTGSPAKTSSGHISIPNPEPVQGKEMSAIVAALGVNL